MCTVPGVGGQDARDAVDFGAFFSCEHGTTPQELLQRGVYNKIALALKGGEWRKASLVMVAQALVGLCNCELDAGASRNRGTPRSSLASAVWNFFLKQRESSEC